jgi:hypothetical protein
VLMLTPRTVRATQLPFNGSLRCATTPVRDRQAIVLSDHWFGAIFGSLQPFTTSAKSAHHPYPGQLCMPQWRVAGVDRT